MQYYIKFIIKNSHLLLFLLLFSIGVFFTINGHNYHKSKIINSSNQMVGSVYETVNEVTSFFGLKDENKKLLEDNKKLKTLLFNKQDTIENKKYFAKNSQRTYDIIVSKVILNKYSSYNNYLMINGGLKNGLKKEMGVVNSKGIVGIVENTSKNFATVMSVLNVKSKINAKVKNSNHFGELNWNGKSTGFIQLIDLPRLTTIKVGDTIVTGNTIFFPDDINIGVIHKVYTDQKTNYFTIDIRLFNDMTNLNSVYVIKNNRKDEIESLIEKTEKPDIKE